jgi:hypothetical protein
MPAAQNAATGLVYIRSRIDDVGIGAKVSNAGRSAMRVVAAAEPALPISLVWFKRKFMPPAQLFRRSIASLYRRQRFTIGGTVWLIGGNSETAVISKMVAKMRNKTIASADTKRRGRDDTIESKGMDDSGVRFSSLIIT